MRSTTRRRSALLSGLLMLAASLVAVAVPTPASAAYPVCTGYSDFYYAGWIKHVPSSQYQNNDVNCVLSRRFPEYRQGTLVLQEALKYCAGQGGIATDGRFGEKTMYALQNFQIMYNNAFGTNIAEDGVYGPETRRAMNNWASWPTYNNGIATPCTSYE